MISLADIQAARAPIGEVIVDTPCLPCRAFSQELGLDLWFKHETLQLTGSLMRGALNRMRSLTPEEAR